MDNFNLFDRYWREWQGKLSAPITRNASQLRFPTVLNKSSKGDGVFEFAPSHPICIYKAPQKAASGKRGSSHKQTIFIDGAFTLRQTNVRPYMVSGKCSASFFKTTQEHDGNLTLKETDAIHFDIESTNPPRAYHPTFHAQRDISNTLTDEVIRTALLEFYRGLDPGKIHLVRFEPIGAQHLRLPTPQMDLFAVLTMIIADFFCNGGDTDPKIATEFKAILNYLTNSRNLAREGLDAVALSGRVADGAYSCPAHWYPEFA